MRDSGEEILRAAAVLLQALDRNGVTAVNWATSAFHLAASSGALEKCVPHALRKIVVGGEAAAGAVREYVEARDPGGGAL